MAFGVSSSIYVDNRSRPPHRFNHDVVGRGREYVNQATAGDRCIISLNAAVSPGGAVRFPLFRRALPVDCHVSTDTGPTVFQGDIANDLKLPRPARPFYRRVTTFLGSYDGPWCNHVVWLSVGPVYLPIDVLFPVQLGPRGWEWQCGFPHWNVLGMSGILSERMICVTSDFVYMFERL